jgi:hypothetical protein
MRLKNSKLSGKNTKKMLVTAIMNNVWLNEIVPKNLVSNSIFDFC